MVLEPGKLGLSDCVRCDHQITRAALAGQNTAAFLLKRAAIVAQRRQRLESESVEALEVLRGRCHRAAMIRNRDRVTIVDRFPARPYR